MSRESSEFEFVSGTAKENTKESEDSEFVGLFGLVSRVAAKTKNSVESVIMVLDPQMKGLSTQ